MAITNQQIFNGCLAGISGAQVTTVPLPTVDNSAAVNAAALAAEAAIAATVGPLAGGGSAQQASIAEALCYAAFAGRRCTDTSQATYTNDVNGLGAYFGAINGKVSGVSGTVKTLAVALNAATPGPQISVKTVVDPAFVGGNTFAAYMTRPSVAASGAASITSLSCYPQTAGCPDGAVNIIVGSIPGYSGATETLTIAVTS